MAKFLGHLTFKILGHEHFNWFLGEHSNERSTPHECVHGNLPGHYSLTWCAQHHHEAFCLMYLNSLGT